MLLRTEAGSVFLDFNKLMEAQGNTGRFQKIAFFLICLAMNGSGFFVYNQGYLMLYPVHQCKFAGDTDWFL